MTTPTIETRRLSSDDDEEADDPELPELRPDPLDALVALPAPSSALPASAI